VLDTHPVVGVVQAWLTQLAPDPQVVQAAPPLPQAELEVPARQVPPLTQPVQQLPLWQVPPLQAVPFPTGVVLQVPLQLTVWQAGAAVQAAQFPPPVPHALVLVPALHCPDCQQPVQQVPPPQVPPLQAVPCGAGLCWQAPLWQASVVQGCASSQLWQPAPPLPHVLVAVPLWQAFPSQQPVQQAPLRHCPPVQAVPSGFWPPLHLPAAQLPVAHSPPCPQLEQAAPPVPQAVVSSPGLQSLPWQQPRQRLCGHVPPQPSSAPWHLPAQSGSQLHLPLGLHVALPGQVPQLPPHPSLPQLLPVQLGVQPLQTLA
jgi:hypothetical protein